MLAPMACMGMVMRNVTASRAGGNEKRTRLRSRRWKSGIVLLLALSFGLTAYWQWMNGPAPDHSRKRKPMLAAAMHGLAQASAEPGAERTDVEAGVHLVANRGGAVPRGFVRGASGKLLPRFVSLARAGAEVRLGPSERYPVAWVMRLAGVPLEVMAETGAWWRVRDHEGEEGWLPASMLSERRSALVAPWNRGGDIALRREPAVDAPLRAVVKGGALVQVLSCNGAWCEVRVADMRGWISQRQLWGVYAGERF